MATPAIDVYGVKDSLKELDKFQRSIENGVVDIFNDHGKTMVKVLKAVVPKKSGNLKKAIKSKVYLDYGKPIKLMVHITRRGFYGYFLEFGTSKLSARPFFFRNMLKYFPEVKKTVQKMINDKINCSNAATRARRSQILNGVFKGK